MTSIPKSIPHLGLYLYTDAVNDIAEANGLDETSKSALWLEMAAAIRKGKLQARVATTGGPAFNPSSEVKVQDVNAWLSANGYPYQWVQQSTPSSAIKTKHPKPLGKRTLALAFNGLHFSYERWVKNLASPPKWLVSCRIAKGTKSNSTPSTWNPVKIALELSGKEITPNRLDLAMAKIPEWAEEWERESAILRP